MTVEEHREQAEKAIQKILIDLWNDTGQDISHVEVDTRNFSNYRTEIFFEKEMP
jgi:hypothetical protein